MENWTISKIGGVQLELYWLTESLFSELQYILWANYAVIHLAGLLFSTVGLLFTVLSPGRSFYFVACNVWNFVPIKMWCSGHCLEFFVIYHLFLRRGWSCLPKSFLIVTLNLGNCKFFLLNFHILQRSQF